MELFLYLAEVSLFWLLLYGCYWLALRRHTFFAWNRAYLLGSLLVAFALPLMPYPEDMPHIAMPTWFAVNEAAPLTELETMDLPKADFATESYAATPADYAPEVVAAPWLDLADWLVIIYCLGACFMATRLFRHLRGMYAFFQKSPCLDMDAYRLYLLNDDSVDMATPGSFSFLNHIVITRRDYELNFDTVLSHELAHVRQRHSWDVLLVEVLRVLFWFNPVLAFYKKSLQQVHEYLADREVCAWEAAPGAVAPRDRYAEFMVSYALTKTPMAALVNPFFKSSLLKDRIVMLYKNKNSKWALGKYAAVALLVGFVSLLAASCGQNKDEKSEIVESTPVADKSLIIEGKVTDTEGTPLPGAVVVVKGTQRGTTTTAQGQFRISATKGSELDFAFIDFKTASVQVDQQGTVDVVLAGKRADEASIARWISPDTGRVEVEQRVKNQLLPNYVTDSVFTVVRTQPEFPGGIKALYRYIDDNIDYPAAARRANISGKVFLTFVVLADGTITQVKILKGMGFGTDEEAIRVVSAMPKWKPGAKENGQKVNVKYNLPISFVLPKEEKEIGRVVPAENAPTLAVAEQKRGSNAEVDSLNGLNYHLPNSGEDFDKNFKINIRGGGFIGNQPLIVLDGVVSPIEMPRYLNDISPNDIESIQILKGEKAKNLYGLRGANGVVLVTTKQGAKMPLDIKK